MQTIATVPDGVMDTAKANQAKNRYLNIHTCESENAEVDMLYTYMTDTTRIYNADTKLAGSSCPCVQSLVLDLLTHD